ncbi:MAG: family 20 glycosylhydrolase, partial [Armatimonadetes bacterium]|nr:family 20 glycosylhydrolase [Armatimonadota bacterium]
ELSAYARAYHLQLIPQFEALGHAAAVLGHEELKHLREAGDPWVFCTSNPATWEFLDTVFGELCEQFPDCKYIHVGADEFEFSFGKCPECRAKVEREGYTGLYAEHMNKLNELVRKRGRTMLFWPSHGGPTPELSYLTVKAADLLQRDCIPTEWIYHGPAAYPEIEQYQKLGFKDVWASPAVVCFSIVWPDYATTYRGIRGFLRAGAQRSIGGAMTTTWEWMYGGVVANSLPGMVYATECAWSLGRTPVEDFERRYGQQWLGLEGAEVGQMVRETLIFPWPEKGPAALLRDGWAMRRLVWEGPRTIRPREALRRPEFKEAAPAMLEAVDAALGRLDRLRAAAQRNADLLQFTELAYRLYRLAAMKLVAMDAATAAYREAGQKVARDRSAAADCVEQAAQAIEGIVPELDRCLELAGAAVAQLGAWEGDVRALEGQKRDTLGLAGELRELAGQLRRGEREDLPPGRTYGLVVGRMVRIGGWDPTVVSEEGTELRFDVTGQLPPVQEVSVELSYTRGAHGLMIDRVALLADGVEIAADVHSGWTGWDHRDNVYLLRLPEIRPGVKYELVAKVRSHGGNDSYGDVWLIVGE